MALRFVSAFIVGTLMTVEFACGSCGSATRPTELTSASEQAALESPTCPACGPDTTCNSYDVCAPDAWYCGPTYYSGGPSDGCDCDCGVPDPDCDLSGVKYWCYGAGQPFEVASCQSCEQEGA